jgi:hypothetical protein
VQPGCPKVQSGTEKDSHCWTGRTYYRPFQRGGV